MVRRFPTREIFTERDSDQKVPNEEDHGQDKGNRTVLTEEI